MATNDLNLTILALQIEQGVKFMGVRFHTPTMASGLSAKEYIYKADPEIYNATALGDWVVVEAQDHMQVVKVTSLDVEPDFGSNILYRWVIDNISNRIAYIDTLKQNENTAKRKITSSRLRREASDILKSLGMDAQSSGLMLLPTVNGSASTASVATSTTDDIQDAATIDDDDDDKKATFTA